MLKRTLVPFVLVALCAALPAPAATTLQRATPSPSPRQRLDDEVVGVQTRPSPAGIVARDALGGAVVGAAIGGGVALCRRYCSSDGNWGNWQRDVGLGAAIGLGVGLLFGAVDAASNADQVFRGPIGEKRDNGFAPAVANYGGRF
jgi:hypothetical protein